MHFRIVEKLDNNWIRISMLCTCKYVSCFFFFLFWLSHSLNGIHSGWLRWLKFISGCGILSVVNAAQFSNRCPTFDQVARVSSLFLLNAPIWPPESQVIDLQQNLATNPNIMVLRLFKYFRLTYIVDNFSEHSCMVFQMKCSILSLPAG